MQINTNMREAPRTGKRILIHTYVYYMNVVSGKFQKNGLSWRECYWDKGQARWRQYEGVGQTSSIHIDPVAWMPVPEDKEA